LALNQDELGAIISEYEKIQNPISITVGFNRRFSPHIQRAKKLIGNTPMNIVATMNAGFIPPDVWVQDMKVGGGRIIGEACHFIDLMVFLTGSKVSSVVMNALGTNPEENTDNAIITLRFENGSQGVINYFSNGSKAYAKERVEIFSQGRVLILDNFRTLKGYGFRDFSSMSTSLDKGHKKQFLELIKQVKAGGTSLIPFEDLINTTKASFAAIESLRTGSWVNI
jgi:predicted dehydrogenase